jgi:sugar lactone lactonase YvrE
MNVTGLSDKALAMIIITWVLTGCSTSGSPLGPSRQLESFPAAEAKGLQGSIKPCPTARCIYVTNQINSGTSTVTVYPSNANGNIQPYRTISGVDDPRGIALDSNGLTYVSNYHDYGLAIYAARADGDSKPLRRIRGRKTGLFDSDGVALDSSGQIYALDEFGSVQVFAAEARGHAEPTRTLRNRTLSPEVEGIALDSGGRIYVTRNETISGQGQGEVLIFAAGAHGHAAPIGKIVGSKTRLSDEPGGVAVDDAGNVYVADSESDQVEVYAAGRFGNVAPIQVIAGSETGLLLPLGIAVDAEHNIYVANESGVTVYAAGANGNVAPIQTIAGDQTGLLPSAIAVH